MSPPRARPDTTSGNEQSPLAWARHPLRLLVLLTASLALSWELTSWLGRATVVLGVVVGVLLGERLGRSRYRSAVLACGPLVGFALVSLVGDLVTRFELVAGLFGSTTALSLGLVLRATAWTVAPLAALRAFTVRRPGLVFLEVAFAAAGFAALFASHRGGVLARPLWLGDWAVRHGHDPATVLLMVGGAAFVTFALLLAAEHGRRTSWLTLLAVPILALVLVMNADLERLAQLPRASDRDQPLTAHGDRPNQLPQAPEADSKQTTGRGERQDEREGGGKGEKGEKGETSEGKSKDGDGRHARDAKNDASNDEKGQREGRPQEVNEGREDERGDASERPQERGESEGHDADATGERPPDDPSRGEGQGEGENAPPPPSEAPDLEDPPPRDSPQNREPMAVVLLGDDYEPPGQMFYLRQETWSQLGDHRLVATTRPDADRDVPIEFPARPTAIADAPPEGARKRIRGTVTLVHQHRRPFALETPVSMAPARNPNPKRFARAYKFEALAQKAPHGSFVSSRVGNPSWSDDLRSYYTRMPDDARFTELAKKLVEKLEPKRRALPFLQALTVKLWMDEQLTYSTRHRHSGVADPTADFLFGDKTGYCVHFAHAAVYLWRSLGIPSRVGVGYAVNAEAREGSALMVQSGDAHAWPELYLEDAGWVVLDIAPKKILDKPPPPSDRDVQRKLAELAREPEPPEDEDTTAKPLAPKVKLHIPWRKLLVALLVGSLLVLYGIKAWRRLAPRVVPRRSLPRVAYRAALDRLAEVGYVRGEGETREAFGRRVAEELPSFATMTDWHVADQFADPARPDHGRDERDRRRWLAALATLASERRSLAKTRRAWLMRLSPASFLASK